MILTVVGSAGSVAGPGNPASCYLVEAEHEGRTWRIVLDLGGGAIGQLQEVCDPARLDALIVSHGHPDHCADLIGLSVLRRYGPAQEAGLPPIPLWGPAGLDRRVVDLAGTGDDNDLAAFAWAPLAAGESRGVGPFTVTAGQAWHPVPALAFSIAGPGERGGRATLAYTGDTDLTDDIVALAADADVLLAEAGWAHREVNPPGVHMTGGQAGELAARARVGALLVTHVASWVDPAATLAQASQGFPGAALAMPGGRHSI